MTQFAESLRLDLTDTLTGNVKFLTNFFQCSGSAILKTETKDQNLLLTLGQCTKHFFQLFF